MVKKGFEIDPFSGVPFQQTEEKVSQLRRGAVWNPEKNKNIKSLKKSILIMEACQFFALNLWI
jgi:hypothetical protein